MVDGNERSRQIFNYARRRMGTIQEVGGIWLFSLVLSFLTQLLIFVSIFVSFVLCPSMIFLVLISLSLSTLFVFMPLATSLELFELLFVYLFLLVCGLFWFMLLASSITFSKLIAFDDFDGSLKKCSKVSSTLSSFLHVLWKDISKMYKKNT